MAVGEKIINDVAVLMVSGKLMGGNETSEIHEHVKGLISNGIKKIVFDFSKVEWINSQGIGLLISSYSSLCNVGGNLRIAGAPERVNSLLEITNLFDIFDTYETAEQAISNF